MKFSTGNKIWLGKKHTLETRQKIAVARKKQLPPMQGKKHTEKTKKIMGESARKRDYSHMLEAKNPNWKGGVNPRTRVSKAPRPKPEQCEICGAFGRDFKKGLCLDHDHTTGVFRGWLCTRCNSALGMVKDNTETLLTMVSYIKNSRT